MSLVAYEASSDDESDYEGDSVSKAIVVANTILPQPSKFDGVIASNGQISDEEDDFIPQMTDKEKGYNNSFSKLLPKPKNDENLTEILESFAKPTFAVLPAPKSIDTQFEIEEADDEFLHKKPNEKMIEQPNKDIETKKIPVKITIPSLKNFKDVEKEVADKARYRNTIASSKTSVSSGLLSILPRAKSEQNFAKVFVTSRENDESFNKTNVAKPAALPFVPDCVKHRRPAANTEDVERIKNSKKKLYKQTDKTSVQSTVNAKSDESDDDNTDSSDFFSFKTDHSLPEISATEINALVANKAAKIIEATANYLEVGESRNIHDAEETQGEENELQSNRKRYHQEMKLNSEALQALAGGSTKRRRQQQSDIQVIDINSSEVMPNKEEWMRTALASSTTYQPTGVLTDEEPASGTRRKHQITYLAHKAKANEAELQAMWAANRQNRRATQSKYGF